MSNTPLFAPLGFAGKFSIADKYVCPVKSKKISFCRSLCKKTLSRLGQGFCKKQYGIILLRSLPLRRQ